MSETNKTGRYSIGQKLLVIAFRNQIPGKGEHPTKRTWVKFYAPHWHYTEHGARTVDICVEELEVIEHHKVPDGNDPKGEKTCDGYILKDSKGNRFTNQYPYAYYGQMSDAGNRIFERDVSHLENEEDRNAVYRGEKEPGEYTLLEEALDSIDPTSPARSGDRRFAALLEKHNSRENLAVKQGPLDEAAIAYHTEGVRRILEAFKTSKFSHNFKLTIDTWHEGASYKLRRWMVKPI